MDQENPSQVCPAAGVWLVPDAVKLTSKMNHNMRGIPKQLGLGKRKWQWESKTYMGPGNREAAATEEGEGERNTQHAVLEQTS